MNSGRRSTVVAISVVDVLVDGSGGSSHSHNHNKVKVVISSELRSGKEAEAWQQRQEWAHSTNSDQYLQES